MQGCFENSNMQWENSKIEKAKCWKIKYEISTDLPSARAHRFESDKWDLSPALLTIVRLILENWTMTNFQPYATLSLTVFFWIMWSEVLQAGVLVNPRALALRCPAGSGSFAPPCA